MPPPMVGYRPYGLKRAKSAQVVLNFDEFEGLKFIHYDGLMQEEAATKMGISRPTFSRLYNQALKKIATAFVEGKSIEIQGGNVEFDKEWLRCKRCYKLIDGNVEHIRCAKCKFFDSSELVNVISK
jgi:predicted DNA-binding protein (UPF0251 family)